MRARRILLASVATFTTLLLSTAAVAQSSASTPRVFRAKLPPVQTQKFGDLAEGPYNRLVLRNVMVVPGHGGPPAGPYEILITGNVISDMREFDPARPGLAGDRVIEGNGICHAGDVGPAPSRARSAWRARAA